MESANKEEAKRCLQKAVDALKQGKTLYAQKLALKSIKLCPTTEAQEFLESVSQNTDRDKESPIRETRTSHDGPSQPPKSSDKDESEEGTYTKEQSEAVKRVLHCKDYYEVLGVSRNATEAELKKRYKHLALVLHPDKNRAPQSDEAFKAISKAYSTLSDPSRKNHYDRFGEDGLHQHSSTPADVSPDDLFRMFFGEGDRNVFFQDDGFIFSGGNLFANRHRNFRSRRHFHTYRNQRQDDGNLLHICQMLPILLIVLVSVFSSIINSILAPAPLYSLYQNSVYSERRVTARYNIPYFVKADFDQDSTRLEQEIVNMYVSDLREKCRADRLWGEGSRSRACAKLKKLK